MYLEYLLLMLHMCLGRYTIKCLYNFMNFFFTMTLGLNKISIISKKTICLITLFFFVFQILLAKLNNFVWVNQNQFDLFHFLCLFFFLSQGGQFFINNRFPYSEIWSNNYWFDPLVLHFLYALCIIFILILEIFAFVEVASHQGLVACSLLIILTLNVIFTITILIIFFTEKFIIKRFKFFLLLLYFFNIYYELHPIQCSLN